MKKILCATLVLALSVSLSACGGSDTPDVKQPSNVTPGGSSQSPEATQVVSTPSAAAIEETVLLDSAGIKITAKSLNTDGLFGAELALLIENNSGKNVTVQTRNSSVNGYMVETMMSTEIADGKKANDTLVFSSSDLDTCGIETIADMEFSFHIFTSEDWKTYLDSELIQIKTSAADGYSYSYNDAGTLAYEGSGVKIVVQGLSENDSIFGPGVLLYIYNSGENGITIQTRDTSVNGFMIEPIFSEEVCPGKRSIAAITFMSSELEENAISEITEVELSFHIFDTTGWDTVVDTDPILITF